MSKAVDHPDNGQRDVRVEFYSVQPNKWTFQSPKIREWVERELHGRVLNVCCGPTKLSHDDEIVRSDIDEDREADLHVDAREISDHVADKFDTIVFDPPFSAYQAQTTYNGETTGYDTAMKKELHKVVSAGGRVIQFGYTTTCMPRSLGYDKEAAAIFQTLGRQNDILATVDRQFQSNFNQIGGDR